MADDLHVIAAPIRFAGNLIKQLIFVTLFIGCYPLVLAGLLYTNHIGHIHAAAAPYYYPPTEDGLYKIVICVLGPFAFVVWFSIAARWAEVNRHGSRWWEEQAGFDPTRGNNLRGCLGWLFSVLGACGALMFCSYNWIEGEPTVWAAAIGHLLPAIVYVPYRLLKNLEEGDQGMGRTWRNFCGYRYYMVRHEDGKRWWHLSQEYGISDWEPFIDERDIKNEPRLSGREFNRLANKWEAYQRGEVSLTPKEQAYMQSCKEISIQAQRTA